MNPKNLIIIAIAAIALTLAYFPFKHYIERRNLTATTTTILKYWQSNNLTATYAYWKDPRRSPPIYGLNSYKILKSRFFTTNGIRASEFYLELDFPAENLLPSGQTWILEYYKFPRLGWLVVDFRQESTLK